MWPQFSPDTFRMFWLAACWRVSHNHTDWPMFWGRYSNSGHLTTQDSSLYEQHWRILSRITSRGSYVPHLKPKVEGPLALKSPVSCYRSNKSFKMKWNCAKCIWSLAEADRGCVTNGWLSLSCAMFVPTLLIMLRHWPRLDCNSHTFCSISLLEIFDIFWIVFQFWSLTLSLHLFSVLKMSTFLLNFCQLSRDFRLETSCF